MTPDNKQQRLDAEIQRALKGMDLPFEQDDWLLMEQELDKRIPPPPISYITNHHVYRLLAAATIAVVCLYGLQASLQNYRAAFTQKMAPIAAKMQSQELPPTPQNANSIAKGENTLSIKALSKKKRQVTENSIEEKKNIQNNSFVAIPATSATTTTTTKNQNVNKKIVNNAEIASSQHAIYQTPKPKTLLAKIEQDQTPDKTVAADFIQHTEVPSTSPISKQLPSVPTQVLPQQAQATASKTLIKPKPPKEAYSIASGSRVQLPTVVLASKQIAALSNHTTHVFTTLPAMERALAASDVFPQLDDSATERESIVLAHSTPQTRTTLTSLSKRKAKTVRTLTPQKTDLPEALKARHYPQKGFQIGLHGVADARSATNKNTSAIDVAAGLSVGWQFNNQWAVETGAFYGRKQFQADNTFDPLADISDHLTPHPELSEPTGQQQIDVVERITTELDLLEIPILAKYSLPEKKGLQPYIAFGPSIYIPVKEKQIYHHNRKSIASYEGEGFLSEALSLDPVATDAIGYDITASSQYTTESATKPVTNKVFSDIVNLRTGFKFKLNERLHVQAEGQWKTSLQKHRLAPESDSVLAKRKRLSSLGFQIGVTYSL